MSDSLEFKLADIYNQAVKQEIKERTGNTSPSLKNHPHKVDKIKTMRYFLKLAQKNGIRIYEDHSLKFNKGEYRYGTDIPEGKLLD